MNHENIDPRVRALVKVIDSYPRIQTIMSCGGHKDPDIKNSQVPENEFYVDFCFKEPIPSKEAWQSLNEIARGISEDSIYEWFNPAESSLKLLIGRDENHFIYFRLRGIDVDPEIIANSLLERPSEAFDTLKPEIPNDQREVSSDSVNKKERKFFLIGIAMGIIGGFFPNLLVSFLMKMLELKTQPPGAVAVEFVMSVVAFLGVIVFFIYEIDKLNETKTH
ncbi:hypothetical protein [Methanoregula sp.]|uniref:hypothetical protein n=1 Tax=Methanoregula sp. TaxID=2052170 RepID=UPI003C7964A0